MDAVARLLALVSHPAVSRAAGHLSDLRLPRPLLDGAVAAYARLLDVAMDEVEHPAGGFGNFDEFFVRRLRPGARPIEGGEEAFVSPADGRVLNHGTVIRGRLLQVKGWTYSVADLLGDEREAARFEGGSFLTVYLSPRDYHRVHAPLAGEVGGFRHIPGPLYPVNRLGVEHVDGLFARNERVVTLLDTARGRMAVVLVGATCVGRISLAFACLRAEAGRMGQLVPLTPARSLARGEELGAFHLGSTVVVLNEAPGPRFAASLERGTPVRMGQALA